MKTTHSFDFASIQEENLGYLNYSLHYDPDQSLLTVRLIQARDLVARDFSGTADPFCRICLLPNRRNQLQSRVHKKTTCPEFEEGFIFDVSPADLISHTLEILLYDYDQFSHDECVGQVLFPLDIFVKTLSNDETATPVTSMYWRPFTPYEKKPEEESYGDLMFSLAYLSSAERLTVAVIKARKLRPIVDNTKSIANPFVRVTVVSTDHGQIRRKRKKTSTKRNAVNPVWNEALVFNVARQRLDNVSVEFTIYNDNLLGNNEPLGEVIVGGATSGEELAHWTDMLNLKNAIARWHRVQAPPPSSGGGGCGGGGGVT